MKRSIINRASFLILFGLGMVFSQESKANHFHGISFQVFYNELSPFGDWVLDPSFGYVWIPYVDQGFHPYGTNGYWEMTNFGNTWVSNYHWGWAAFHYGRWFWDDFYGWAWVPGYEWGPAWVNWRTGGGYYGWAPLGPGLHVSIGFNIPSNHWVFIPQRRFRSRDFYRYCAPSFFVTQIYQRTTVINNTYVYNNNTYYSGPSKRDIERSTRTVVPVYEVSDSEKPGRTVVQKDRISVYRPEIKEEKTRNENLRPTRTYTAEEYRNRPTLETRSGQSSTRSVQNQNPRESNRQSDSEDEFKRENYRNPNIERTESATPSRNLQNRNDSFEQTQPSRSQTRPNQVQNQETRSRNNSPSTERGNSRSDQSPSSQKPDISKSIENSRRNAEATRQQVNQRSQETIRREPAQRQQSSPPSNSRLEAKPIRSQDSSSPGSKRRSTTTSRGSGRGGN